MKPYRVTPQILLLVNMLFKKKLISYICKYYLPRPSFSGPSLSHTHIEKHIKYRKNAWSVLVRCGLQPDCPPELSEWPMRRDPVSANTPGGSAAAREKVNQPSLACSQVACRQYIIALKKGLFSVVSIQFLLSLHLAI